MLNIRCSGVWTGPIRQSSETRRWRWLGERRRNRNIYTCAFWLFAQFLASYKVNPIFDDDSTYISCVSYMSCIRHSLQNKMNHINMNRLNNETAPSPFFFSIDLIWDDVCFFAEWWSMIWRNSFCVKMKRKLFREKSFINFELDLDSHQPRSLPVIVDRQCFGQRCESACVRQPSIFFQPEISTFQILVSSILFHISTQMLLCAAFSKFDQLSVGCNL